MLVLSEVEMRILSELEEAGEEDVVTMMATIMQPTGEITDVSEMQRALEGLVRVDLIRMSADRDASGWLKDLSKDQSLGVIADLQSNLRFNSDRGLWTDRRHSGPPYGDPFPYIVNTASGKIKGFEILNERGYQWWRQRT